MSWSWRIGRIAGIDVYLHGTFLILIAWVALTHYFAHYSLTEAVAGAGFVLSLFGIVVLHELGHALAAGRYGIATRDITLLPIGGVARLERMPEDPKQELVVALAGPAVNVVLAAILFAILQVGEGLSSMDGVMLVGGKFLDQLLWVNVSLAVFNLLPAFPMDGGRVLRAFLAMRMDYVRATQTAASVGQAMALLFGFIGLFINPFLVFIALFVWMGAAQESSMVQMRSALGNIPVQRAMITQFHVLSPDETLRRAVEHVLQGFQQDFPVVEGDRVVGILTRADLLSALAQRGQDDLVGEIMKRDFETASPFDMLGVVLGRLQERGCRTMPVVYGSRLVGLLSADHLSEMLLIQEAERKTRMRT
jgi:Zn-dependent protease/CBS domain-containing protein